MDWKAIEGYRYPYRINDQGEVQKQVGPDKWKTLKQCAYGNIMRVDLRLPDGKTVRPSVSKMVADYFMGGTPPGMMRVHRNWLKADNAKENIVFRPRGKSGARPGNCRPVLKVDRAGNVVAIYRSTVEAAKKNHISQAAIGKRCLRRIKDPYRLDGYNYIYEERKERKKKNA